MNFSHLQIRNSKEDETPLESASQIFSSLLPAKTSLWKNMWNTVHHTGFEIYLLSQTIYFYVSTPASKDTFVKSIVSSAYPNIKISPTKDPLSYITSSKTLAMGEMVLASDYYLPIKTYNDFRDIDPLSSLLGFLARTPAHIKVGIQILPTPATFGWQKSATKYAQSTTYDKNTERYGMNPEKFQITKKTAYQGGKTLIRLVAAAPTKEEAASFLSNLAGTFGAFALGEGNQFKFISQKSPAFLKAIETRSTGAFEHRQQILNASEIATLWHPPGILLKGIKNISWGKTLSGEAPENLPIPEGISPEEKKDINFFAKTEFKNKEQIFGLKTPDRRKHVYIIGKTGTGKSTLIANMAIDDIRADRGVGIIDPHGDLSEIILNYIPKRRMNDVVYLEPFDLTRPFHMNMLEVKNAEQKHLVASGIISIFYKLYGNSWGPRLEYIFRNVILTLLEIPGSTLADVISILADESFRKKAISTLQDPVLKAFWTNEFTKMSSQLRAEAVSPIQNKVGQFVTTPMIRNIIGHSDSTIDLTEIMDQGKILIVNLSQGKLGEDNAALLGALMITRIQLSAMGRSFQKEDDRRDFFLYVDEFQNFATHSFIKILSEARKYRLALTLANQYIDQLEREVSDAIFGNIGTLISFIVGARDSLMLTKEFGKVYSENDLVSLGKFETVVKLSVDNITTAPFPATTLPLPSMKNDNADKIIRMSKEKYGRKV